ncbi:MAG: hypothetical protein CMM08_09285 [Rhodospirillaceae bacterium]|nr:hypothetical protein [Rhodospirillaceae bacterium]
MSCSSSATWPTWCSPYEPDSHHRGISTVIEFAVRNLNVEHITVLGHSHCGGIRRLCEGHEDVQNREFIDGWMSCMRR